MYTALLAICASLAMPPVASAEQLQALFALYRCPIAERLAKINRASSPGEMNRFLVVALRDSPQSYVQCMLLDEGLALGCEASSGRYGPREGESVFRVSSSGKRALADLGFGVAASEGNYPQLIHVESPAEYGTVAELILTALHRAYGARPDAAVELYAPLAPSDPAAYAHCAPSS